MKKLVVKYIIAIAILLGLLIPIQLSSVNSGKHIIGLKAEAKKKKSKEFNCRTYFNTTVKATKSDCKKIKKLNKQSQQIDNEYSNCANRLRKGLANCIKSAKRQSRKMGVSYTEELDNWCRNLWKVDESTQQCWDTRNQKIRSIWFQFVDSA